MAAPAPSPAPRARAIDSASARLPCAMAARADRKNAASAAMRACSAFRAAARACASCAAWAWPEAPLCGRGGERTLRAAGGAGEPARTSAQAQTMTEGRPNAPRVRLEAGPAGDVVARRQTWGVARL